MPPGWRGFLITGPFLPEADRQRIRQLIGTRSDCTLIEELVEADRYIARADKVISMAGYNTITSILSFAKPALVVPRILPRQEQWIRASQLAGRGLLTLMEPSQLSPTAIGNWIAERNVPTPQTDSVDLGGLERIANRVLRWLPRHCSPMSNFRREIAVV
jgi:predicted glycosyltransferase